MESEARPAGQHQPWFRLPGAQRQRPRHQQRAHVANRHGSDEHRGGPLDSAWQRRLTIFPWQAFKVVGNNVLYTNGNYVATQGGGNRGVLRSATALNQPLTAYVAIQEQYLSQAGIADPVSKIPGARNMIQASC